MNNSILKGHVWHIMFGTFYSHTLLNFNQNGISNGLQKDFGKVFHIFEGMLNDIVQNNPFKT